MTTTTMEELDTQIQCEDLMIDGDTKGIQLHLRHKWNAAMEGPRAEKTLLMMHGATYASGSVFDVKLEGSSFMDLLAAKGYDVYALDARGYGLSSRPAEMEEPAEKNQPIVRTETAVQDLGSAVDFLLKRLDVPQINLLGMSWGGTVSGTYTSRHNDKIRKLVLVAPQWINSERSRLDSGAPLGAYRLIPLLSARESWFDGVPEDKRQRLLPKGGFEQWLAAALADAPRKEEQEQRVLRVPSGAVQDIREFWSAGKSFYDPGKISVPVLYIRAEWDVHVPLAVAQSYFRELTGAPERRWLEIAEGTHLILLEKNRLRAMKATISFLDEE